ncbi:Alpha-2-macroglobulin receptor-associated protein [Amphibalanus amphitrite]|uniref:Alpha-2-macroglobulin receptor-associated protein n=1 Tax=Amphibalanus amphitrite TaxID=1232801 RepID=A0A6A4X7I4_AMPAM|nr:Alpha-2-macroglobulin receptor-associated protein [Amphibalanus amphitrite]
MEPKVDGLWQMARKGDFTAEELESLWTELKHYEQRLQKLRHVQMDMLSKDGRHRHTDDDDLPDKTGMYPWNWCRLVWAAPGRV